MTKSYIGLSTSKVLGTLALDNFDRTFTESSSGSGTGNTKRAAAGASLNASNKAIFARILLRLGDLLADTTLAENKLLNFITNNVTADSQIYALIKLSKIATTKDGFNYVLNTRNIIKPDQYCEVTSGQTLTGDEGTYKVNNGILKISGGRMRLGTISANSAAGARGGIIVGRNASIIVSAPKKGGVRSTWQDGGRSGIIVG